ncbi:TPA: biotin transporter BioY [Clostridioides difficile]|jgi:biotin transport system substrate-specific component
MKISIKEMVLVSLFTALTAIGAFLSIPLGDVPITLQSMFTILAGLLLGPKLGSLSQLIYVLLGLSGVRIFAGFSGGPQTILKPSFGFLIGFIFAALVVGKIAHKKNPLDIKKIFLATLVGTFIIYLFGLPYMYLVLNNVVGKSITFSTAIKTGCLIFLPGDMLKAVLSSLVASKVLQRVNIAKS